MRVLLLVSTLVLGSTTGASAQHAGHTGSQQPYAGQETRAIKVLSAQDLADLGAGRGFGFTKAAELNGVPGPVHLLELRVELGLTPAQTQSIDAIFVAMRTDAVALGQRLIEIEREFGRRFAAGTLGANELRDLLGRIAEVTGVLRYAHLAAHLETPALLTEAQIASYRRLRGYAN